MPSYLRVALCLHEFELCLCEFDLEVVNGALERHDVVASCGRRSHRLQFLHLQAAAVIPLERRCVCAVCVRVRVFVCACVHMCVCVHVCAFVCAAA